MKSQCLIFVCFFTVGCSAAGKLNPSEPVHAITLQPVAVGVSEQEANAVLAEAQHILRGANVELMLKETYSAFECPQTSGVVCLERDWLGWIPLPHMRGEADLDHSYITVRLIRFLNHYNGKLVAHEIAHLLGAKHTYRGLMFPEADSLAFATGFAPESLQQMHR